MEQRPRVKAFIRKNRLQALLRQAREPLETAFGKGTLRRLTLVQDDEGIETLFCLLNIPGNVEAARRALKSFDSAWWLARAQRASGKLDFDFELV